MGRLIDADELKERFCEENCGNNRCVDQMDKCAWICSVEESKTVYDVNNVVEQLTGIKGRYSDLALITNNCSEIKKYIGMTQAIALAIEIVKGGGVE